MVDIKEKIESPADAGKEAPAVTVTSDKTPDVVCAPPQASRGEKLYNGIVYQGINYWLNLAISLVVTDIFAHGKGKNFFNKTVSHMTDGIAASGMLKRKSAKRLSEIAAGTFTLNSGGNILLIPTKYLEDYKRPIVHWLNKKLGTAQVDANGRELEADEIYIEHEQPKQSWGRMVFRRVLAFGATTAVGVGLDKSLARKHPNGPITVDGSLQTHEPGQNVFTDAVRTGANMTLENVVPGGKKIAANGAVQRYMGYAALDTIYTAITSKVLHMTNGAKKMHEPREVGGEKDPPDREALISSSRATPRAKPAKKQADSYAELVTSQRQSGAADAQLMSP